MLLDVVKSAVRGLGTQKDAALKTGIAYATLQRVLSGDSPLTAERLSKILDAVEPEWRVAIQRQLDAGDANSSVASDLSCTSFAKPRFSYVPLHHVAVSAGAGINAVEAGDTFESLGFPDMWLREKFGDIQGLRIVNIKGDSMTPTLRDGDMVMFDINRRDPVDGVFVLRMNDQLMVKRIHFPSSRRLLVTSDNKDYERYDRLVDLERDDTLALLGRVVWAGKSF